MSGQRRIPAELRTASFPVAVRGYDRHAVDAYVTRINRLVAELEATRSPQSAVENALRRAEDQRSDILKEAYAMGGEITTAARREAGERTAKAKAEAVEIVVDAGERADRTRAEADEYSAKARAEAEQILARARAVAEDRLQRTEEEIAILCRDVETWMRALRIDTNAIWGERRDLLDDLRDIAARLEEAAARSSGSSSSAEIPSD